MIYILLILVTIPLAYLWQNKATSYGQKMYHVGNYAIKFNSNIFALIAFLPLFIIYASQCSVHSDYDNYQIMYSMVSIGQHAVRDPAVYSIFRVLSHLGLPFQSVYFIIYFISFTLLAICIRDYSTDYALSLTMVMTLFFMLGFYYIRQLVAVMLVFYAYRYIRNGSWVKYFILIFIAATFHTSALAMVPGYFLLHYRFKTSFYIAILSIFAILNVLKDTVLTWIVAKFIPQYFGRHEMFRSFSFELPDTIIILSLIFITLVFIFKSRNVTQKRQTQYESVFLSGLVFYFILYFFGRWILEFERFGYYFYIPVICLYPHMIDVISDNNKESESKDIPAATNTTKVFLKLVTYIMLLLFFYFKYSGDTVWHYTSIFN